MFPIGILTKDRPLYLDATLRSLSGSGINQPAPLTVFDDASGTRAGFLHLHSNYQTWIEVEKCWPVFPKELQIPLRPGMKMVQGLRGLVNIETIGEDSLGVWGASCFALNYLAAKYPESNGFLLMQDDILLKPDWFGKLSEAIAIAPPKTGIISGLTVVHQKSFPAGIVKVDNVTAQLLYITREFYNAGLDFFTAPVTQRRYFDSAICCLARERDYSIQLLSPYIARHIGIDSAVNPGQTWEPFKQEQNVAGPFAWAANVRNFL